jgi:hypothetical protein
MKGKCFTEPLFHKVVNGEITQMRQIVNPQPETCGEFRFGCPQRIDGTYILPRYKIGETVYLKEPFVIDFGTKKIIYKYGNNSGFARMCPKWGNALFMPAKYARHFIKITGVRCERLQDITNSDCMKSGIFSHTSHARQYWKFPGSDSWYFYSPKYAFAEFIDYTSGKGTWECNPFVWVYDFELVK